METKVQVLADHLRTVHFALLVLAIVLVLGSLASSPPDVTSAAKSASAIEKVKTKLAELSKSVDTINKEQRLGRYRSVPNGQDVLISFHNEESASTPDELCRRPGLCSHGEPPHSPTRLERQGKTPFDATESWSPVR